MADVVNLRTARKRAKRQKGALAAEASRFAHGRPKSVRELEAALQAKADRDLNQHRIEKGGGR